MQISSMKFSYSCSAFVMYILISGFLVHKNVITVQALIPLPENVTIPAVIAFGDSIVDPGNNNNLVSIGRCNFPPYGRDFKGGEPTGRFSNGKIPTDFIVEELGIKEYLPAYLDPNLKSDDLLTGVSFASGGSGYDPLTSQIWRVIGLEEQMKMFKEYIGKLKAITGEERTAIILKDSIYIVVAGSNDLTINYFNTPFRKLHYDIPAYTDFMVQKASSFTQELYDLGARRIFVFSAPPIGCLPGQRTSAGEIHRECPDQQNEAAILYNSKLFLELDRLNNNLEGGRVIYTDIYTPLFDIIKNPTHYGFEVVDKGCCGTGHVELAVLCNNLAKGTCENDSKYVFWDTYHPTQKTYEELVDRILKKYVKTIF